LINQKTYRVGAAQDLAELDLDLAAITQAGGCKLPRMPLQCAEKRRRSCGKIRNGEGGREGGDSIGE
jgi:hypothetical protein